MQLLAAGPRHWYQNLGYVYMCFPYYQNPQQQQQQQHPQQLL
jgi:hypothetical protein